MNQHTFTLLQSNPSFNWSTVISAITAMVAITVSIIALRINRRMARRNIRLSIQQAIFKIVSEKAKDCNALWEAETDRSYENATHFKVMSELIITTEIIEKSIEIFSTNDKLITLIKDNFYWLFWKQLRTDLRGWVKHTPEIVKQMNPKNIYYSQQVTDLYLKFENHFEKVL
jgi:hypothetical protein